MANFKGTLPLLIFGLTALIGSIPFFFIKKPIVVSHQAYGKAQSSTEIIDHKTGIIYGTALAGSGIFILFIYIRASRPSPNDWKRKQRQ